MLDKDHKNCIILYGLSVALFTIETVEFFLDQGLLVVRI